MLYILVAVSYAYIWEDSRTNTFIMVCTYRPAHLSREESYYKRKKFQMDPYGYCPSRRIIKDD